MELSDDLIGNQKLNTGEPVTDWVPAQSYAVRYLKPVDTPKIKPEPVKDFASQELMIWLLNGDSYEAINERIKLSGERPLALKFLLSHPKLLVSQLWPSCHDAKRKIATCRHRPAAMLTTAACKTCQFDGLGHCNLFNLKILGIKEIDTVKELQRDFEPTPEPVPVDNEARELFWGWEMKIDIDCPPLLDDTATDMDKHAGKSSAGFDQWLQQ